MQIERHPQTSTQAFCLLSCWASSLHRAINRNCFLKLSFDGSIILGNCVLEEKKGTKGTQLPQDRSKIQTFCYHLKMTQIIFYLNYMCFSEIIGRIFGSHSFSWKMATLKILFNVKILWPPLKKGLLSILIIFFLSNFKLHITSMIFFVTILRNEKFPIEKVNHPGLEINHIQIEL